MTWKGPVSKFLLDETRFLDLEGAIRSGKTTAAVWKVLTSCLEHPGIQWLICRYSDGDTQSKLKPEWRKACLEAGTYPQWNAHEQYDLLPNGSLVYILGLKAQDQISRYAKLRGLTLAGIYVDQAEELPEDVFNELQGRLSQKGHPHQLMLTPNPPDEGHWIARYFPEANNLKDYRYIRVSVYDNEHNLDPTVIPNLVASWPVAHAKHRTLVLGRRGLNVIGLPVYGGDKEKGLVPAFMRQTHEQSLTMNSQLPLLEAIDFGKHNPCVVWAQYTPYGQMHLLGGVMGQNLYLEDFAPIIQQYRSQWFPNALAVWTCCDPAGSHDNSQGVRKNGVTVLQDYGFNVQWKDNSNAPDVRLAMIERIAAYMRRRTPQGEAFGIETRADRWLRVGATHVTPMKFLADGFEAGYVWDTLYISVGGKQTRRPKKDGWYEHGQNCCEYLELNFGGAQPTAEQVQRRAAKMHAAELRRLQRDVDPYDVRVRRISGGRGGYG